MPNPFYNASGTPGFHAPGSSGAIDAEFAAIAAGFDLISSILDADPADFITQAFADGRYAQLTGAAFTGSIGVGIDPPGDYGADVMWSLGSIVTSSFQLNVHNTQAQPFEFVHRGNAGFKWFARISSVGMQLTAAGALSVETSITAPVFVGNVQGNVAGNVLGSLTGNADTAGFATNAGFASTAGSASSAASVPWSGVSGRPVNVSEFINDAGYVTSVGAAAAGSLTGTTLAANVTASSLTSLGTITALSAGTGNFTGNVTAPQFNGALNGNASTATSASTTPFASVANVAHGIDVAASNGYGNRTVSTSAPSGGSDGDIWYQY